MPAERKVEKWPSHPTLLAKSSRENSLICWVLGQTILTQFSFHLDILQDSRVFLVKAL